MSVSKPVSKPESGVEAPPLLLIKGDATDEEVAAVVAVLQGMAAAGGAVPKDTGPVSQWAAPHRKVRSTHPHGSGGWRGSALPR